MMSDGSTLPVNRSRVIGLILFGALVLTVLTLKSLSEGWFKPRLPLPSYGKPVLIFFTLEHGCQCQMTVVANAESQLVAWKTPDELGLPLLRVNFDRRYDLAQQYNVARAPALVLLDTEGQVFWKQDVGLSDEAPLDLAIAEIQIGDLFERPGGQNID